MGLTFNSATDTISSTSGTVTISGLAGASSFTAGSVSYSQGSSGGLVSNAAYTTSSKIILSCQVADYTSVPGSAPYAANVGNGTFRIAFPNSLSNAATVNYIII